MSLLITDHVTILLPLQHCYGAKATFIIIILLYYELNVDGCDCAVDEYAIYTPDEYNYTRAMVMTTRVQSLQFTVKACNDAMLALSRLPGTTSVETYEVALGTQQNAKCEIRKAGSSNPVASANAAVLNCNEDRFIVVIIVLFRYVSELAYFILLVKC